LHSTVANAGKRILLPTSVIEQAIDAEVSAWLDRALFWRQRDAEIERPRALL
jgi:hypothetical protein